MMIKEKVNGCEVNISFVSKSADIKDKVLWLILECFKSRVSYYNNSSYSYLYSK